MDGGSEMFENGGALGLRFTSFDLIYAHRTTGCEDTPPIMSTVHVDFALAMSRLRRTGTETLDVSETDRPCLRRLRQTL